MTNHYSLYTFTKTRIAEMRAEARAGRKDDARDFLRFVRNSRIVEILKQTEFPDTFKIDVSLLDWELSQLETECHPASACDQTSDIKAIRVSLELIAGFLSKQTGGAK